MSNQLWFVDDADEETDSECVSVGVDEVGRGALAGPVAVGCCALSEGEVPGLDDSKKLTTRQRNDLFDQIDDATDAWIVLASEAWEIDEHGISLCLEHLMRVSVQWVLDQVGGDAVVTVDGNVAIEGLECDQRVMEGADAEVDSVSAASIMAKVLRDRHMVAVGLEHPGYDMGENKGYGTGNHRSGIVKHGSCGQHRMTFQPVGLDPSELPDREDRLKDVRAMVDNPFVAGDDCPIRMHLLGASV